MEIPVALDADGWRRGIVLRQYRQCHSRNNVETPLRHGKKRELVDKAKQNIRGLRTD